MCFSFYTISYHISSFLFPPISLQMCYASYYCNPKLVFVLVSKNAITKTVGSTSSFAILAKKNRLMCYFTNRLYDTNPKMQIRWDGIRRYKFFSLLQLTSTGKRMMMSMIITIPDPLSLLSYHITSAPFKKEMCSVKKELS